MYCGINASRFPGGPWHGAEILVAAVPRCRFRWQSSERPLAVVLGMSSRKSLKPRVARAVIALRVLKRSKLKGSNLLYLLGLAFFRNYVEHK